MLLSSLHLLKLQFLRRLCLKQRPRRHLLPRRRQLFRPPLKQHLSQRWSIPHLRPHQLRFRRQPRQLPCRQKRRLRQKARLQPLQFRHPLPSRSQPSRLNRLQHKAKMRPRKKFRRRHQQQLMAWQRQMPQALPHRPLDLPALSELAEHRPVRS
jgi:hypothetical protein